MTPEFYIKAQALHEEFQKRELHYLNIERKINKNLLWKKDLNLPLQEYLQKINQKEKETDAAYQSIMNQMEELDRHADAMSFKLEKLGILRSSVSNTLTSNWMQKLDSGIVSNLQSNSTHGLPSVSNTLQPSLKSVSTQTENDIYCIKCNASMFENNLSSQLSKNVLLSNLHIYSSKAETTQSSNFPINLQSSSKDDCENFDFLKKDNAVNGSYVDFNTENSKTEQIVQHLLKQSLGPTSADNNGKDIQKELPQNKVSFAVNPQGYQSKSEEKSSLSLPVVNEKLNETLIIDVESNMDSFVSKSDAESINNEFDFLESDTNKPSRKGTKPSTENVKLSDNPTVEKLNKTPVSTETKFQEPKRNSELEDNIEKKSTPNPNSGDNKSETSESMSGYHSPNMSVTSDSDSIYEKGSPLTASAAYQALLGNTALLKKAPQNVIESESEDEVENAFANAVQRTNVKNKSVDKQKKEEIELEEKPVDKSNKMSSMNKPQSKLSKNTRKVLGLDTSSGSDIEMAVKPISEKKIDEDSDEFDFYD